MNCSRIPLLLTGLLLSLTLPAGVRANTADALVTTDLVNVRVIEDVDVSADGARVVCQVHESMQSAEGESTFARHLWLVNLVRSDQAPIALTTGQRTDRQPVFSPDGRSIAFYRLEPDNLYQVYVVPVDGGEPRALVQLPQGVDSSSPLDWSSDGATILVTGWHPLTDSSEETQEPGTPGGSLRSIEHWLEGNAEAGDPTVKTIELDPMFRGVSSNRRIPWLLDVRDPLIKQPAQPLNVFPGDVIDAVFAGGEPTIFCTVISTSVPEPGRRPRSAIGRIDLGSNQGSIVVKSSEFDLAHPRVSGNGETLAFLGRSHLAPFLDPVRLGLADVQASTVQEPSWLTGPSGFDRSVRDFAWRAGQDSLLLTALDDGGIDLLTLSRTLLSQPRSLLSQDDDLAIGIDAFASGGGVVATARTAVDNPSELWLLDAQGSQRRWNPNTWIRDRHLSIPRTGWATPRGEDPVPYWLYPPRDVSRDRDIPLVILMHSGPGAMVGPGMLTDWFQTQLLTSWGFAVLQMNPRGSQGYGQDVFRGAFRDVTRGPSRDALSVLKAIRVEDPKYGAGGLFLIARSYGTLAAVWMLAADNAFDAAILEDGVYHVPTHLAEHPDWSKMIELLGGLPQDPSVNAIILDTDPTSHLDRITTPILLMTGSTGGPATVLETEVFYRMLALGFRTVELVSYSLQDAGPTLHQQLDRFDRILSYLAAALESPPKAP